MLEVIEFLKSKKYEKTKVYEQLKCTVDEAKGFTISFKKST